jgi:uncharacterized protein (DUF2141 family)
VSSQEGRGREVDAAFLFWDSSCVARSLRLPKVPNRLAKSDTLSGMNLLQRLSASAILVLFIAGALFVGAQTSQAPAKAAGPTYTLTVIVEGVNQEDGNIGVLVFQNDKGWPEDRLAAMKDVVVPAHSGTVEVKVPDLPAGEYAIAVAHDANKNRKLDKNFLGKPKEQWGLSGNPHAVLKAPPFSKCKFTLNRDMVLHITMQL